MEIDWFQGLIRDLLALQRSVQSSLGQSFSEAVGSDDLTKAALVLALALVFGSVHAIGPGHGKSVMMAYFVGREAKPWHGLLASIKLIVTHVGSAIVLVLVAVTIIKISFGIRPADFPVVRQISYAGVAAIGIFLLIQSVRRRQPHSHASSGGVLPFVVGLSPCPLTTIIMLAAISTGALAFGLLVSVAMALGMVATLTAFSLVAILARRWLFATLERHMDRIMRWSQGFEIVGAISVTAIGALLLAGELA